MRALYYGLILLSCGRFPYRNNLKPNTSMKKTFLILAALCSFAAAKGFGGDIIANGVRPSAYPLITIDPYTSAWSMTDRLYDQSVKHWTGKDFPLIGVLKVDGEIYRFMGAETVSAETVVPSSQAKTGWSAKYTTEKPGANWMKADFDDSKWSVGQGAFGSKEEPLARTEWNTQFIWIRRQVDVKQDLAGRRVYVEYTHDDDLTIFINGKKVVDTGNKTGRSVRAYLSDDVIASLKGQVTIAALCNNRMGPGFVDFSVMAERRNEAVLTRTATQTSAQVQATQTLYSFDCGPVKLELSFIAPLFMDDLDLMARPVNYIAYNVESKDGAEHNVEVYFEASAAWAIDNASQASAVETLKSGKFAMVKAGSDQQKILARRGDDLRIDWGYFYLAGDASKFAAQVGPAKDLRTAFINGTAVKASRKPVSGDGNNMSLSQKLGKVKSASGRVLLAYDDIYSIQYFKENLRPYWNRTGKSNIMAQIELADTQFDALVKRCYEFDYNLMKEAAKAGGQKYAELCALAYRQAISAHKLVQAPNGDLLFLSKENNSNGSIGTVDITYPSSPMFLYYNPELAKGLMNHIYYYSESGKWKKPFPAHDVGTYPLANGQTYGGDMPVEEAGNMIVLTGVVSAIEGNAKYAEKHWDVLTVWTDYLVEKGLDPENQLCTDDFAGHFAHNTNLSVKAIMGIACYAYMADMLGKKDVAAKYNAKAREMAAEWEKMANDGDHYRLTFDKAGTWSQKYNMVWDKILNLNIFPKQIIPTEILYYLDKQNVYGLPLDNRKEYTKTDWVIWTATMAPNQATFEKFIDPIWKFENETVSRVPMSDWIWTDKPEWRGFKARSVVGGYFIKMLDYRMNGGK